MNLTEKLKLIGLTQRYHCDLDEKDFIHEGSSTGDDGEAEQDQEEAVSWLFLYNLHSFIVFKTRYCMIVCMDFKKIESIEILLKCFRPKLNRSKVCRLKTLASETSRGHVTTANISTDKVYHLSQDT
jgi:hypothetical protein